MLTREEIEVQYVFLEGLLAQLFIQNRYMHLVRMVVTLGSTTSNCNCPSDLFGLMLLIYYPLKSMEAERREDIRILSLEWHITCRQNLNPRFKVEGVRNAELCGWEHQERQALARYMSQRT